MWLRRVHTSDAAYRFRAGARRGSLSPLLALLVAAGGAALPAVRARAGNDDTYFMSSRAALVGGAVSAVAGDPGAIWYNPAGLGSITRQQLDLSLTVAAWQARQIDAGLAATVAGRELTTTLDGNRTTIVSPSTVYVRRLGRLTVGAGLFVSRDDVADVAGTTEARVGDVSGFSYAALTTEETRYHLGVATGFPVHDKVRFGLALFGIYDGFHSDIRIALNTRDGDALGAVQLDLRDRTTRWGVELTAGLQVDAWPGLTLALFVRSPVLLLYDDPDAQTVATVVLQEQGVQIFDDALLRRASPLRALEPLRLVLGLSYVPGRWGLYAEGDWAHALQGQNIGFSSSDPTYLVNRDALWNVRAGAHWDALRDLRLGAGFFTDRSPKRGSQLPTDFDVDYYGLSLGAMLTQRVGLAAGERVRSLLFRTSLALRYAVGFGDTAQLRVDPDLDSSTPVLDDSQTVDVGFHELYVTIGSALHF